MNFKKVFLIIIPFLLAVIIIVYTPKGKNAESSAYNMKKENYNMNNYLEKNHSEVDVNSCSGFNLLDEDIKKNDVILAGEYKGVSDNYLVKLSMVKYMNEKHDVIYLLEDIGWSQAYYINQYLKSGNESLLKSIYFSTEGYDYTIEETNSDFDYMESYDFWIKLREYNMTLPEKKRVIVIGIGLESRESTALKYINSLIPESEPAAEIKPYIKAFKDKYKEKNELKKNSEKIFKSLKNPQDELDKINKISKQQQKNNEEILKSIEKLKKNMETYPGIYENYLGSKFFDFHIVIDNMNFFEIVPNDHESNMYSNFKRIYSYLPIGKYFGEFNMEQVYQNTPINMRDDTRFAAYLNGSDSPVTGRVLSIAYAYENSKAWSDSSAENGAENAEPFDVDLLKNISKSDITLFKLNGDNSPFSTKSYFVISKDDMHTTDYFKYIILIKNSNAANPSWKRMIKEGE